MTEIIPGSKEQVNLLKGLAIAAVVLIHIVNTRLGFVLRQGDEWNMLVVADQLARFCVPLFVALSGYALAKKYTGKKLGLGEFYSKRVLRLLPLYLLWTGVYFLSDKLKTSFDNFGSVIYWVNVLIHGWGQYHLYFVPMIFQAYILFPIIYFLVKKYPRITLILSMVIQIGVFIWINGPGWSDQTQYVLFGTWQLYFVAGIYLAVTNIQNFKGVFWGMAGLGLIRAVWMMFSDVNQGVNLIMATRFTRWPIVVYSAGLIFGFLGTKKAVKTLKWPGKMLMSMGKHSYLIYLCHVLFLQILTYGLIKGNLSLPIIEVTAVGILALGLSVKIGG
jgi:peptidoglycan/LPS O-acetylase OafA/YrhL